MDDFMGPRRFSSALTSYPVLRNTPSRAPGQSQYLSRVLGGNSLNGGAAGIIASNTATVALTTQPDLYPVTPVYSTPDYTGVGDLWINGRQQVTDDGAGGIRNRHVLILLDSNALIYQALLQGQLVQLAPTQISVGTDSTSGDPIFAFLPMGFSLT